MREMPPQFSRKWWKLWRSGAIDRKSIYFRHLAKLLRIRQKEVPSYGYANPSLVERGEYLGNVTPGTKDTMAVAAQELRLSYEQYESLATQLVGPYMRSD